MPVPLLMRQANFDASEALAGQQLGPGWGRQSEVGTASFQNEPQGSGGLLDKEKTNLLLRGQGGGKRPTPVEAARKVVKGLLVPLQHGIAVANRHLAKLNLI